MADVGKMFRRFYKKYDRNDVIKEYNTADLSFNIFNTYKPISFDVEARMKNDCFAIQISSEDVLPLGLMTVIGFYFENYSYDRNCVWTKNEKRIKQFFVSGVDELRSYGGKITLNILNDSIPKIVHIMTSDSIWI